MLDAEFCALSNLFIFNLSRRSRTTGNLEETDVFEEFEKYFLARFVILTVLVLKTVVLSSELSLASMSVKIIGGHIGQEIFHPCEGISVC